MITGRTVPASGAARGVSSPAGMPLGSNGHKVHTKVASASALVMPANGFQWWRTAVCFLGLASTASRILTLSAKRVVAPSSVGRVGMTASVSVTGSMCDSG